MKPRRVFNAALIFVRVSAGRKKRRFLISKLFFRLSCTDVLDLTKAEMDGRQQAMNALLALKSVVPGFEKAKLRNFGMTIGTRDSRKIIGR